MTIRNAGGRDKLIGVAASLPSTVIELHDVRENRMVRIDEIPVPARDAVELKPGSFHIMIFKYAEDHPDGLGAGPDAPVPAVRGTNSTGPVPEIETENKRQVLQLAAFGPIYCSSHS